MAKKDGAKNIAERVSVLLEQTVNSLGFTLWDVEYKKEGSDYNLILTIDSDEREITIDDCVAVTDAVNPILDESDPIPDSYCLEVSSAGLERTLSKDAHFSKYLGREVEVKLFSPHEALGKAFVAPISSFDEESLTFGDVKIERAKIANVKAFVDYKKLFSDK